MNDQHAEQIMAVARQLNSETVRHVGANVHVSFRGFDRARAEIGRAMVTVTSSGIQLSELEHTRCSSGLAWSRRLAASLGQLDAYTREVVLH
jgi:hypothetical protein